MNSILEGERFVEVQYLLLFAFYEYIDYMLAKYTKCKKLSNLL